MKCQPSRPTSIARMPVIALVNSEGLEVEMDEVLPVKSTFSFSMISFVYFTTNSARVDFPLAGIPARPTMRRSVEGILFVIVQLKTFDGHNPKFGARFEIVRSEFRWS